MKSILRDKLQLVVLTVIFALAITLLLCAPAAAEKNFSFKFHVDKDGFTRVAIFFYDDESGGSWLLIPKDQMNCVRLIVYEGNVTDVYYNSLFEGEEEDPFYVVMNFTYVAHGSANFSVEYVMRNGGLIIEPKAIFVSPRIMHEDAGYTKTLTFLPAYATINEKKVAAISGTIKDVKVLRQVDHVVVEASVSSSDRLVVEYEVPSPCNVTTVASENVVFEVPYRYLDFAYDVLNALNEGYRLYANVFGTGLENVKVRFFVPSINDILSGLQGYVPFEAGKLGAIHLNLLYIRGIEGFASLIALHELAHHFLWHIGVPQSKLWIHEGASEYLSLYVGRRLGYAKAAALRENTLTQALGGLESLEFIQQWTPFNTPPQGLQRCYAASYYVFKTLCEKYGETRYLESLFTAFKSVDWSNNTQVIEAFGVAAGNTSEVISMFNKWGFRDGALKVPSILYVERALDAMPFWLEPYRGAARLLVLAAKVLLQHGVVRGSTLMVGAAHFICFLSPYMFLISLASAIAGILLFRRL
ncbi:MAG: hypothetical protein QFX33_01750 [Candidatus Nezhaarchaeota archaeon]|nr:hypothetical protein [Candidatus Nezhaarchaeota archaeon]